jgi:hypothetical protein
VHYPTASPAAQCALLYTKVICGWRIGRIGSADLSKQWWEGFQPNP